MAYADRYKLHIKDNLGQTWIAVIQDESGDPIESFVADGEPLSLEYYGSDDIIDSSQSILGSQLAIRVITNTSFQYVDLFTAENLAYPVFLYVGGSESDNGTLFWQGYILANNYQEPYNCVPFTTEIVATDGLGLLKDFPFSDLGYTGRELMSDVIHEILFKIGVTVFREALYMYEISMDATVDDSPLDQTYFDTDLFQDSSCYDALEAILKTFGAKIRQHYYANYYIYNPLILSTATVYLRIFTRGSGKSSGTLTPELFLNRPGHVSSFRDVEGGTMTIVPGIKKFIVSQDFGNKDSWLDNWQFEPDKWDGTNFENWTKSSSSIYINPVSTLLAGEAVGAEIVCVASQQYIYNTFGALSMVSANDFFIFEIEFGYYNTALTSQDAYHWMKVIQDGNYLTPVDVNNAEWLASDNNIFIRSDLPCVPGFSGWLTHKMQFKALPSSGDIVVQTSTADPVYSPYIHICIRNVRFYCSSTQTVQYQKKRNIFQRIQGGWNGDFYLRNKYVKIEYKEPINNITQKIQNIAVLTTGSDVTVDFVMGDVNDPDMDNVVEQFAGSLSTAAGQTVEWTGDGGANYTELLYLIGNAMAYQYSRAKQILELPVLETSVNTFLPLHSNIVDSLNLVGLTNRIFVIAKGSFDIKNRRWKLTLTEII